MNSNDFIKYAEDLLKIALNKCRDINIAEDLVQDTILAALVSVSNGKHVETPYAWLISVLNNKYYDWLRSKYNKPVISYDVLPIEFPDDSNDLESIVNKEFFEVIRKELAYLSKIYREVMVRYYMKDESISQISKALDIPIGTVKSRLDTGRKRIKEGVINMEKYTKQSYEPDILSISCSGASGLNNEPFSIIANDKIAENILIMAYPKPLTEIELSKMLGIPAAYIEPIVNKLIDGDLVKRISNGKIYTDFIIYTEEDRTATFDKQKEIVSQYFDLFWTPMYEGLKELRQAEFYKKQSKSKQQKLENHFCIHTLMYATIRVRDEVTGHMPYSEYPYRKDGGRWIAIGNMFKADYDYRNSSYVNYIVSGEARTEKYNYQDTKYICLAEYDTILGKTPVREVKMSQDIILELLYELYKEEDFQTSTVNPFYFDEIPTFEKLGVVARKDGKAILNIPVLTSREYHDLKELSNRHLERISDRVRDVLIGVFKDGYVRLPEHLTSVPNWQRYMFCGDSVPMMVILKAMEKSLYSGNIESSSPAMILVVDK